MLIVEQISTLTVDADTAAFDVNTGSGGFGFNTANNGSFNLNIGGNGSVGINDNSGTGSIDMNAGTNGVAINSNGPVYLNADNIGNFYINGLNPVTSTTIAGTSAPTDPCSATQNTYVIEINATPTAYQCSNATGSYAWNTLGGGGGGSVNVNGSPVSSPNFNGTTPAAPGGNTNCTWQVSGSSVSCYVPNGGGGGASQFFTGSVAGTSPQTYTLVASAATNTMYKICSAWTFLTGSGSVTGETMVLTWTSAQTVNTTQTFAVPEFNTSAVVQPTCTTVYAQPGTVSH